MSYIIQFRPIKFYLTHDFFSPFHRQIAVLNDEQNRQDCGETVTSLVGPHSGFETDSEFEHDSEFEIPAQCLSDQGLNELHDGFTG